MVPNIKEEIAFQMRTFKRNFIISCKKEIIMEIRRHVATVVLCLRRFKLPISIPDGWQYIALAPEHGHETSKPRKNVRMEG